MSAADNAVPRVRYVHTVGSSAFRQGLSSSAYGGVNTGQMGLWIPPFVNTPTTRYLFLLSTAVISRPTRIVSLGQHLTLICRFTSGGVTTYMEQALQPATLNFEFPDGNVSWHLVMEPNDNEILQRPSTDAPSFCFRGADGSALLYEHATWSAGNFNPVTGAPNFYEVGMTAYTPPAKVTRWTGIGGLGSFYDLRFPWVNLSSSMGIVLDVRTSTRVSFYASVLQTDPHTRVEPNIGATAISLVPSPWDFIKAFPFGDGTQTGVQWGRVGGYMVFDENYNKDTCSDDAFKAPSSGGQ